MQKVYCEYNNRMWDLYSPKDDECFTMTPEDARTAPNWFNMIQRFWDWTLGSDGITRLGRNEDMNPWRLEAQGVRTTSDAWTSYVPLPILVFEVLRDPVFSDATVSMNKNMSAMLIHFSGPYASARLEIARHLDSDKQYLGLYTPNIQKERAPHNVHVFKTMDESKILHTLRRRVVPNTFEKVVAHTFRSASSEADSFKYEHDDQVGRLKRDIQKHIDFEHGMRSIEKIDGKYYMPVTEAWYKDFKALTDYEADRKGISSGKKFTVVYIENETRLHVADVSQSKDYSYAEIDKHVVYGEENFPTELAQKMSILQMVSDQELKAGQVGTGFKLNPHLFYLYN